MAESNEYQCLALGNVELIKGYEVKKVVTSCPFCLRMFEDGIKSADVEGKLKTKDIAEVLAERLS